MEEKETLVRPSLLSADFTHLGRDFRELIHNNIQAVHFDVMDGSFVKDISFGEPVFRACQNAFGKKIGIDVHLMVRNPLKQAERFYQLGAREIAIHYEALRGRFDAVRRFRARHPDCLLGLAINPATDVSLVLGLGSLFDYYLVMSVVPGKGGQSFIEGSEKKIRALSDARSINHLDYKIMVDGGINATTGPLCVRNGADYLVAGSYYFRAEDRSAALRKIHEGI